MMLAGLAKLAAAVTVAASTAHLPFTDPNQAGWLTLCGTNLKPVTSGSVTAQPFVWRVVSDIPAPKGYFVKGAKATLFAYQPRPGTPAGAWSGTVMGAASYYRNPVHPMAQFTPIDPALTQMTVAYPPIWDHLIELRLYLSAPRTPVLSVHYAAADIEVTGSTWRLVAGGRASCTAGKVQAVETSVGMPGSGGTPKSSPSGRPSAPAPRSTGSRAPSSAGSAGQSRSPGASASGPGASPSPTSAGSGPPTVAAPVSEPTGLSGATATGLITGMAIGVALIFMAIIGRLLWRRQRRSSG